QIKTTLDNGTKYLLSVQTRAGHWEKDDVSLLVPGGWSGLVMLALLEAGVSPDHEKMKKGLEYLRKLEPDKTYARALQTMVFAKAGKAEDKERIQRNVHWLIDAMVMDGNKLLGWTYQKAGRGLAADNS